MQTKIYPTKYVPSVFFSQVYALQKGEIAELPIGSKTAAFVLEKVQVLATDIGDTHTVITVLIPENPERESRIVTLDPLSNDHMVELFLTL